MQKFNVSDYSSSVTHRGVIMAIRSSSVFTGLSLHPDHLCSTWDKKKKTFFSLDLVKTSGSRGWVYLTLFCVLFLYLANITESFQPFRQGLLFWQRTKWLCTSWVFQKSSLWLLKGLTWGLQRMTCSLLGSTGRRTRTTRLWCTPALHTNDIHPISVGKVHILRELVQSSLHKF